jgi:hypothetical protein
MPSWLRSPYLAKATEASIIYRDSCWAASPVPVDRSEVLAALTSE